MSRIEFDERLADSYEIYCIMGRIYSLIVMMEVE